MALFYVFETSTVIGDVKTLMCIFNYGLVLSFTILYVMKQNKNHSFSLLSL